ncbi:MAG: type II toxin-antitoxin system HipA family toxin [Deltaproteobacteria bacterium]|nr:MAG: type II toxin-antitoxin system HipA family toxin [Deltaproteobacteria bacterium]
MSGRALRVSVGGQLVGHLWYDGRRSTFQLHESYLDAPRRQVLGQHFEDRLHRVARSCKGFYPWFENALPERGGALRRLVSRDLDMSDDDSFELLEKLGRDLPGAVEIVGDVSMDAPRPHVTEPELGSLNTHRFSLGGYQLKFSLSGTPDRLTFEHRDARGSSWIAKVGTEAFPGLAENEHAILSWCRAARFDVPETHVVPLESLPLSGSLPRVPTAFLIRRYDRVQGRRVHQEDFAQVLNVPPARKYDATDSAGLVKLAHQVLGPSGAEEALRRLVVVLATGNGDAHLKNWSLTYPDGQNPTWSPLYDQVATVAFPSVSKTLALRIGSAKHLHEVSVDHLHWVASKVGIGAPRCDELVEETLGRLRSTFPEIGMPHALEDLLPAHWSRVPLLRAHGLR